MPGLATLSRNRFLVLGRAGMDLYADPPGTRIEEARAFTTALGGSAGNIAAALVRQGAGADLLSCVSDDGVGRFALAEMDRYNIGRAHVRVAGGQSRTTLALAETRAVEGRTVIYRNGAADFDLRAEDVAGVDFTVFGALVVTGTALAAEPSRGATLAAIARAQAAGVAVVLDVDWRPYSWTSRAEAREFCCQAAAASDIVVGNDVEFDLLAGADGAGLGAARDLVARGAAIAVHKMGEKGAVTVSSKGEIVTGIYRVSALKPTGAGDAFMGGFLAALAGNQPVRNAVLCGSAAAAIVVARVGCAPAMPTRDEVDAFMVARPDPVI